MADAICDKKQEINGAATFRILLLAATLLLLTPQSIAQGEERQQVQFYTKWYFMPGTSYGECNANCMASCLPACYAAAAAANTISNNCGSVCPSSCPSNCAGFFSGVPEAADDGLPPLLNDPAAFAQGNWQNLDGGGITTGDGEKPESNLPEAGVFVGDQTCPEFAPDGHPMRWDQILGCYDIYWKNDYCARGATCNNEAPCTGLQGCMWNGAACVPCTSPSCIYSCPGGAGQPIRALQKDIPKPLAVPAIKNADLPTQDVGQTPSSQDAGETSAAKNSKTPTTISTTGASVTQQEDSQQQAVQEAAQLEQQNQIQTPPPTCNSYRNCTACAKAPKDGEYSLCAWSQFLNACVDDEIWDVVNASGLKVGWVTETKYCQEEQDIYCFRYTDCLSCTGKGGVKRSCQWSASENKCTPYTPLGQFRTEANPANNDIILPALCPEHDCSQYSGCLQCEQNAMCLWSKEEEQCVEFEGDGAMELYYFYPNNCPQDAGAAKPVPASAPVMCPSNCICDKEANVLKCDGKGVNTTGLVSPGRALTNAGASSQMQKVDGITFSQAGSDSIYTIRGQRDGMFIFFIPVTLDITAEVDARSGAVKKVEQPWWGFLTG